jgi:hypothetical protein
MKQQSLKMDNGELVIFYRSENGITACPVCGMLSADSPPWSEDGGSFDMCSSCKTEYGVDDGMAPTTPIGAFAKRWEELRIDWLNLNNWSSTALAQLANIGIDPEEMKKRKPQS